MKKRTWIVVIAVACVATPVFAQDKDAERPKESEGTKIALINLRVVYERYSAVKEFNRQLESELEPYKKAKAVFANVEPCWIDPTPEQLRYLAELEKEATQIVNVKYRDKKDSIQKEVTLAIEAVAKAYGFQVVLAYGIPKVVNSNVFLSLRGEDSERDRMNGGFAPIYIHPSVNITDAVIATLNDFPCRPAHAREK